MKSEFQQTASNAGIIGLMAFGGALVGFVLQLLVAFYFGAGTSTDAYFMALSTSELLTKLLMGGSITAVFIPLFVDQLTRGRRQNAWELGLNIFHLMAAIYIVIVVVLAVFARPFIHFVAPGFSGETFELTVTLLRVLLPSFLFLFLVELATSMLHALRQFALPALLRVVAPLVSIISILVLVRTFGIYALAIGTLAGSITQFGILLWGLRRHGLSYRFIFRPQDPLIRRILYLVYPFILAVLVTQGAGVVYRILVSELPAGSLAALKFAEKITQLATIIFLNSITLVIYPLLSAKASKRDVQGIRETIGSAIRLLVFVTVPVVIGVVTLREPLIDLLYHRGSFTAEDAQMTSAALLFLVIGLTTNGISSILGHTVLALKQTRASVAVTIASQAVAIALFVLLVPRMAHTGLALASSLVPLSSATLYFLYLTRFIPRLHRIFWHSTYVKTIILALLLAFGLLVITAIPWANTLPEPYRVFWRLVIPSAIGGLLFFGAAYVWQIHEMRAVIDIIRQKFSKWGFGSLPVE